MSTPARELLPVAPGRESARYGWNLLRRQPAWLAASVGAFLATGLVGLLPVFLIGRVVDAVREGGDGARETVIWSVVAIAITGLMGAVLAAVAISSLSKCVAPALAQLREEVLDKALDLPPQRVEAAGVGDIVSRVGDDVGQVSQSLDEAVPATITSAVTLLFTLAGLFTLDWRLGLAGVAAAPSYMLAVRWYVPRSAPLYRQERTAQGERADALVTGVQASGTLRAFGRAELAQERIETTSSAAVSVTIRVYRMFMTFGFRMNMSELIGLTAVLAAGFWTVQSGAGTVGDATAAALFFHRLFGPIGMLLFLFDVVQAAGAAVTRLVGVATMAPTPGGPLAVEPKPALELRNVRHEYEPGREVLAPVSLTIAHGTVVALVGATGAGKTTLGAIASGGLRPTSGQVLLGGHDVYAAHPSAVRTHIALVSQEVHLFSGTLRDNLLLAHPTADDATLTQALQDVEAAAWVRMLPSGLDTVVGEGGHPLTAPQAQQVALARVLLADPAVVVMDEATAEAGSAGARDLEASARAVLRGRSAVVIAHRLTQAREADLVVVMAEGRVVEQGTHDALLASGGTYATLWQAWSR